MKKIYLSLVAIIIVALVWVVARKKPEIVEKPKTDKEYFEDGIKQTKSIFSLFSVGPRPELSAEEKEEFQKNLIPTTNFAIATFQELINKYPDSKWADDAQFLLADAYFFQGSSDKSIEAYRKVIINYPNGRLETYTEKALISALPKSNLCAQAQKRIADIYFKIKRNYAQGLIENFKVINAYPNDPMAVSAAIDIGLYANESKDYEPAIEAYQKLLKNRDNKPKDIAFFEKKIKELKTKQAALKKQG